MAKGTTRVSKTEERSSSPLLDRGSLLTKGERTRARIVAAAVRQFSENGYQDTSVASVAREARLTPASVYPYFTTKHGLFLGALDDEISRWVDVGIEATRFSDTPWLSLLLSLLESIDTHLLIQRVLAEEVPELVREALNRPGVLRVFEQLTFDLDEAATAGVVTLQTEPKHIARSFETIFLGLALVRVRAGVDNFDDRLHSLGELLIQSKIFGLQTPTKRTDVRVKSKEAIASMKTQSKR